MELIQVGARSEVDGQLRARSGTDSPVGATVELKLTARQEQERELIAWQELEVKWTARQELEMELIQQERS